MTTTEYWLKEINDACETDEDIGPEIVSALIIAHQLRDIVTLLDQIRNQIQLVGEAIDNQ